MKFSLVTGGEYHPSGLGAWDMMLDRTGKWVATWKRMGLETQFGPFQLGREENEQLWSLIKQANLSGLNSSIRPGFPDEGRYVFTFQKNQEEKNLELWEGDVRKLVTIKRLMTEINGLLQQYTGQNANL